MLDATNTKIKASVPINSGRTLNLLIIASLPKTIKSPKKTLMTIATKANVPKIDVVFCPNIAVQLFVITPILTVKAIAEAIKVKLNEPKHQAFYKMIMVLLNLKHL